MNNRRDQRGIVSQWCCLHSEHFCGPTFPHCPSMTNPWVQEIKYGNTDARHFPQIWSGLCHHTMPKISCSQRPVSKRRLHFWWNRMLGFHTGLILSLWLQWLGVQVYRGEADAPVFLRVQHGFPWKVWFTPWITQLKMTFWIAGCNDGDQVFELNCTWALYFAWFAHLDAAFGYSGALRRTVYIWTLIVVVIISLL